MSAPNLTRKRATTEKKGLKLKITDRKKTSNKGKETDGKNIGTVKRVKEKSR